VRSVLPELHQVPARLRPGSRFWSEIDLLDRVSIVDKRWQNRLSSCSACRQPFVGGTLVWQRGSSAHEQRTLPCNKVEGLPFFEMGNFHLRTDKYITTNADLPPEPVR
jgi:hypothetical protein